MNAWMLCPVFFVAAVAPAVAEDWPAYDRDARRSAQTPEQLSLPLGVLWTHEALQRPRPAWTEPGRTANMFGFDSAFQPVAVGGLVYFGSSADDTLYALRASDGSVQWTFTAGAPIRFAPQVAAARCYFSSDDGTIYCLDAKQGTVIWQFRAAPQDRMVVGNGRMISRWPCRTGVAVHEGTLYATAGMFPSEGICYYALDAATGRQKWCNDTLNALYLSYPHDGVSFGGPTPQGYLLTDGARLVVPTGQSAPAVLDAQTGKLLHWPQQKPGSTWARWGESAGKGFVMVAGRGWQPDQDIRLGEAPLFRGDGIAFYDLESGEVTTNKKWLAYDQLQGSVRQGLERWRGQVTPIGGRDRSILADGRLYASGMGSIEAIDTRGETLSRVWKVSHPRVYSMILAGDLLLAGSDGAVTAVRTTDGSVAWQGQVDGAVHGLAVAGGVLYASTDHGTLVAFAANRPNPPVALRLLADEPPRTGFALVVGGQSTAAAEKLAAETNLNVVCLLADAASIPAARRSLLGRGYGQRLVIHPLPKGGRLPYADYFANQIVVERSTAGLPPGELVRVLHPCTGQLRLVDFAPEEISKFAQQAGLSAGEVNGSLVTRSPLPGAFDWNSNNQVDERVKWPLELLWFGGPGRERTLARHRQGLPPPVAAFGRTFVPGDGYVTAVDAYNGCELWTRAAGGYQYVSADDQHVYIGLPGRVLQCDAQTGRLRKAFGKATPVVIPLDGPKSFAAKPASDYGGAVQVVRGEAALELTLTTATPTPDEKDCWTLWFDFRETSARLTPGGRGAFPLIVNTAQGTLRKFDGFVGAVAPEVQLARRDGQLLLTMDWEQIKKLTGKKPDDFELSAELTLHNDFQVRLRSRPLTDGRDPWQHGAATFVTTNAKARLNPWAEVDQAPLSDVPAHAQGWGRTPLHARHDGNVPRPPLATQANPALRDRLNPLTGDTQSRDYVRGYGCSGTISSCTMDFFRSGTIGMYDLADDSGMRNFAGVRPGCRITIVPALGVLVSTEGVGDCFCPYNFSTTMALAPAAQRRQEDWAVFVDQTRVAQMQRLALNLGAPGDRRDESGALWLGYPRQPMMLATGGFIGPTPHALGLPAELEMLEGGGPVRVNADRVGIADTREPWVYASAMTGVQKVSLGVLYREPKSVCLAPPVGPGPKLDARLDDAAWKGDAGISIATDSKSPSKKGRVLARSDREHLYLAYEQLPIIDRKGVAAPWNDSYFDVLFKDAATSSYVHLSVTADGVKSSRAIHGVAATPRLAQVAIDGQPDDWRDQGVELPLEAGRGSLRIGWTDEGFVLLAKLNPAAEKPAPGLRVQFGNREHPAVVEAVINVSDKTATMLELADRKSPAKNGETPDVVDDENPGKQELERVRETREIKPPLAVRQQGETLWVEALVPFAGLKLKGARGDVASLQVVNFDPQAADRNISTGVGARRALLGKGNLLSLALADKAEAGQPILTSTLRREWFGSTVVFAARQRTISAEAWHSASQADKDSFRVEAAIPWKMLDEAGLSRQRLLAQFHTTGSAISNLDVLGMKFAAGAFRIHASEQPLQPLGYQLRLHFAEIEHKQPGERVFDIKVQGRTVVEGLDVAREAGGANRALSKSFEIEPSEALTLEFVPRAGLPLLNGLELIAHESR